MKFSAIIFSEARIIRLNFKNLTWRQALSYAMALNSRKYKALSQSDFSRIAALMAERGVMFKSAQMMNYQLRQAQAFYKEESLILPLKNYKIYFGKRDIILESKNTKPKFIPLKDLVFHGYTV